MNKYRYYVYGLILAGGIVLAWLLRSSANVPVGQPAPSEPRPDATAPNEVVFGSLALRVPEGWRAERPSSTMRLGQFSLPGNEMGDKDAELSIFSGIGGGTESNLARWFDQFQQPDGAPSSDRARTWRFTQGDMGITMADLSGTYMGSGMMTGQQVDLSNYRLLAAIVETSDDTYYFKLVGPQATVERWAMSFETFIRTVRRVGR
ncbi:MAG: hypothetical protein V3U24_05290 [Candidatus Neomarinimicrobiota bacterium]